MRAAGVKREYGCCIFRFRIFLTSYARRTGNAAASGHMRAKARLSAFKKRFSSCGIRQPAAQIYIFGGMQRSVSCPPARRRYARRTSAKTLPTAARGPIRRRAAPAHTARRAAGQHRLRGGLSRSETPCQRAPRQRRPFRAAYGRRYAEYAFHPAARKKRRMHCKFSFFPPRKPLARPHGNGNSIASICEYFNRNA